MKKGMGVGLVVLLVGAPAFGADADDQEIEQLRRELRALQDEVSTLRRAVFEIAESDRRRAGVLSGVLGGRDTSSAAPALPNRGGERAERTETRSRRTRRKAARAPTLDASREAAAGRVVGRVAVPKSEPVAYVYVQDIKGRMVRGQTVNIDQRGKQFVPNWAVIRRGTTVNFPNDDNIYHNVFSRTKGSNFDLGLYRRGESSKSHRFLKTGPVDVYCNIHPKMAARILVVPNGHFTKVESDGSFVLDKVPVGSRTIAAWSPGSKLATMKIQVNDSKTTEVLLKLNQRASAHLNKHGAPYGSYP